MIHEDIARKLSRAARHLLVAHVDGTAPNVADNHHQATLATLMTAELVSFGPGEQSARPRFSRITENGREVLGYVLAEFAEALVRAGHLEAVPVALAPFKTPEPVNRRLTESA